MGFKFKYFIFLSAIICAFSCKKDTNTKTVDFSYTYFPLEEGHFVTYKVDSISYNDFFNPVLVTKSTFYIKEVVADEFVDLQGRKSRRIERFKKINLNDDWQVYNVYYATITATTAEKIEENQRFIKLIFPIAEEKQWLGNNFINPINELLYLKNWNYTMSNIHQPKSIGALSFDSTLVVLQQYDSSAINITTSVEQYATNVGLIYKELRVLASQNNFNLPWEERAEQGYIFRMTIVDYGKE